MTARLFSREKLIFKTKKTLHRLPKAFLLSAMLFMIVFGNILPVFAQLDTAYNNYKYLFNSAAATTQNLGTNTHTFTYSGPIVDEQKKTVPGLWFNFSYKFADPAFTWDHITSPLGSNNTHNNDGFVLRSCDTDASGQIAPASCIFSKILYIYSPNGTDSQDLDKVFGPLRKGSIAGAIKAKLGVDPSNDVLFLRKMVDVSAITKKDGSGNYSSDRNMELMATKWFTLDMVGTSKYVENLDFLTKNQQSVSLWYCSSKVNGNGSGSPAFSDTDPAGAYNSGTNGQNPDPNNVQKFGSLCGGDTYFKIDEVQIDKPASITAAANTFSSITPGDTHNNFTKDSLPGCDLFNGSWITGDGSFMGCIAQLVYYAIYVPIAWFAGIMGNLFDFFIGYTLDDQAYRADFVVTAWGVIRDISNIFFILILVWTGLAAVFGVEKVSMKKVIPQLIINALLINFSLFGVRLVVDASNIFANIFYNRINTTITKDGQVVSTDRSGVGGYKPLSEKLIEGFDPQRIFSARNASVEQYNASLVNSSTSISTSQKKANDAAVVVDTNSTRYANYYILVSLLAAAIMFGVAVMFWKTAFFFLGRVIGIYITMIFAPFALLTRGNMPIVGSIPKLKWGDWAKELVDYALLAPIFVFFLYVIYLLVNSKFLDSSLSALRQPDVGFFATILSIAIPMLIIFYMIREGSKLAEKYAGEAGGIVQEYLSGAANKIGGFAVGAGIGVATAGTAVVGRNVLGRLGQRIARSERLQNASASGRWYSGLANRAIGAGQGMSKASYDARNIRLPKQVREQAAQFGITGAGVNNRFLGALNANQQQTSGGFQSAVQRETQRLSRRAERFQLTGNQAAAQDAQNRVWENDYQNDRNTAQQAAIAAGQAFDEVVYRQTYIQNQAAAGNVRPQTSAEINRQREQDFSAAMQRGTFLARVSRVITNRQAVPGAAVGAANIAAGAIGAGAVLAGTAAAAGEGAIQNEAQQTIVNQRRNLGRDPISAQQRTNMQNELNRLNSELLRITQRLTTIGQTPAFNPPIPYNQLTQANMIDYRDYLNQQLVGVRQQITNDEDFIRLNQNNPAQAGAVQFRRQRIATNRGNESRMQSDIRESQTILNEYNRVNTRMNDIRTNLGV